MSFIVDLVEIILRFTDLEKQKLEFTTQVSNFRGQKVTADKNLEYYEGTIKHNGDTMSTGERKDYEGRKVAAIAECTALAQSLHADEMALASIVSEIASLDLRKNSIILDAYEYLDLTNVEGIHTLGQAQERAKSITSEDKGQVRKTLATDDSSKLVLRPKLTFASLADVLLQLAFEITDFTTAGNNIRLFVHDKLADYEMPLLFSSWEQRFGQCIFQSKEKVAALQTLLVSIINNCPTQSFAKILAHDPIRWSKLISMVDTAFKQLVLIDNINRALSLYSRVFSGKHPRELFTVNFKLSPQCRSVIVPPTVQLSMALSSMMSKSIFSICPTTGISDLVSIQTSSSPKAVDPYQKYCREHPATVALLASLDKDIDACVDGITEATCKIEKSFGHLWSPQMTQKTSKELNAAAIDFELEHYPRTSIKEAILLNSFPLQDATISMIRIQIDNAKDKEFKRGVETLSGDSTMPAAISLESMRTGDLPDDAAVLAASRYTFTNRLVADDPLTFAKQIIQKTMPPLSPAVKSNKMVVNSSSTPQRNPPPTTSSNTTPVAQHRTPPQPTDRNILSPRNTKYETVYVPPPQTAAPIPEAAPSPVASSVRNKPRTVEPLQPSALDSMRTSNASSIPSVNTSTKEVVPKAAPLPSVTSSRPTVASSPAVVEKKIVQAPIAEKKADPVVLAAVKTTSPLKQPSTSTAAKEEPTVNKTPPKQPKGPTTRVPEPVPASLPPVVDSGRGRIPPPAAKQPTTTPLQESSPMTKVERVLEPTPLPARTSPQKAQSSPRESTAYSLGRLNSGGGKTTAFAPPGRVGSAQVHSGRGSRPPSQGTGTTQRTPVRVFQNAGPTHQPDSGRNGAKNAWATPPHKSSPTTFVEEVADASGYKGARVTTNAYPSPIIQLKPNAVYNETTSTRSSHSNNNGGGDTSSIPREGRTVPSDIPHYSQAPSTAPIGGTRAQHHKAAAADPTPTVATTTMDEDDEALLKSLMKKEKDSLDRIRQIKEREEERRNAAQRQIAEQSSNAAREEKDRLKALETKLQDENRRREERKNVERAETERVRKSLEAEKFKEMEQRFERRNTPPPIHRSEVQPTTTTTTAPAPSRPDSALRRKLSLAQNTAESLQTAATKLPSQQQPTPPSAPPPNTIHAGRKPSTAPVSTSASDASPPLISPRELSQMSLLDAYKQFCTRLGMKPNSGILKLLPNTPGEYISNINLDLNYIGVRGFKPLLEILRINRGLRFLNLKDNNLENSEVKALVSVLMGESGDQLTHIDLSNNPISLAGGSSLMDLVNRQRALTTIVLKGTLIQQKVVEKILEAASANSN